MLCFLYLAVALQGAAVLASAHELSMDEIARRYTRRTPGGVHIPIVGRQTTSMARRASSTAIGLGDFVDVAYTVLLTIGGITTPMILDTGSSDLWVMSDACTQGCSDNVAAYSQASFQYSGVDVDMLYGDSATGTFASGKVGDDTVGLAGLTLDNQYFAAINRTNTSVSDVGAAGIFGLGFPVNSVIWNKIFADEYKDRLTRRGHRRAEETPLARPNVKLGSPFPNLQFRRTRFPALSGLLGAGASAQRLSLGARQTSTLIYKAFESYSTIGPLISRFVATSALTQPMFSVTLQRDSIDIGGNVGILSIGELPDGLTSKNLTWVPLRLYSYDDGGLPAPANSPSEVYPITWEVMLDGVYFDGEKLPTSNLSSSSIGLSALVDTGNSLLRGPSDVVQIIANKLGNVFSCSEAHTIGFEIGGAMFNVDPRDFISQAFVDNVDGCVANLVATDPPSIGGYQFSWSLGTPFLKGVLASYYYGNLTYPTQDPPKMGFMSTVPSNVADLLQKAVTAAAKADNNYPAISETAPAGTIVPTNSNGVAQATHTSTTTQSTANAALSIKYPLSFRSLVVVIAAGFIPSLL